MEKEQRKKLVQKEIYRQYFPGLLYEIKVSDLPKNALPTDIINIEREEAFYSENDSWDEHTNLIILREREETDEEFEKRIQEEKRFSEELKARRKETYLKLKKEFEPGINKHEFE